MIMLVFELAWHVILVVSKGKKKKSFNLSGYLWFCELISYGCDSWKHSSSQKSLPCGSQGHIAGRAISLQRGHRCNTTSGPDVQILS